MTTLVTWPTLGDFTTWKDTGEGGMFAYAFWPAPKAECHIDVAPTVGIADVLLSAVGPLADAFAEQKAAYAAHWRRDRRDATPEEEEEFYSTLDAGFRIPFGTVVFLGSTDISFASSFAGDYFVVSPGALTEEGHTIVDALTAVYGEPTFATYLDT